MPLADKEFACIACRCMVAADDFPESGLCKNCEEAPTSEHPNHCACIRCEEEHDPREPIECPMWMMGREY